MQTACSYTQLAPRTPAFLCQAMTLVMSPVTPAPKRGKQTDNSHQHHQIWGSGDLGTVYTRKGVAPGPRRGSQNYSLLAGAQPVAKDLARSGLVVAGRGGADRAVI